MSGSRYRWRAIGRSVIGAAHTRGGLPNQDRLRLPNVASGEPLILALADGHGSARSFRSHRGAWFAVKAAREIARPLSDVEQSATVLNRWVESDLPRTLVRRWRDLVDEDIEHDPFSEGEMSRLGVVDATHPRRWLAYGATLLIVVITDDFISYLQLGDGDILTVSEEGDVARPLPPDERLMGNETTSLCQEDAWREVRTAFQRIAGVPPALIVAATDGYSNSFRDDQSFLQVGSDLLQLLRQEGAKYVEDNLEGWLTEASAAGSGDDVTVGIFYRIPDNPDPSNAEPAA